MISIFSNPSYFIPPLIGVAVTFFLLIMALLWSRRDFATKLFSGILLCLALVNVVVFGMRSSPDIYHALLWEKALAVTYLPAYVIYYHFTLVYSHNGGQRHILLAFYLLAIVVAVLSPTNLIFEGMEVGEYGYAPVMGPLAYPLFIVGPLLALVGAFNLLKYYRAYPDNPERVRLIYLAAAAVFPVFGALWDGLTTLPPMFIWSNLIFCILCTIAILKYRLLDIQIFVRKSSVYVVVSAAVAAPYVLILLLVNHFLGSTAEAWWAHAIILLLLAIVLRPLYGWAQNLVDRLFFRRRYDYLRALESFSRETHHISNLNQLSYSLVKLVSRALSSSDVQLFLVSNINNFTRVASVEKKKPQFNVPSIDFLKQWLRDNSGLLYLRDLTILSQLKPSAITRMHRSSEAQAEVIVPIVTREHNLIGILALGKKLSEQSYSQEDELLLITVSNHIAVQLENARLYALEKSTRRELERQDERKTEFLHSVAHELKTPLTSIIASSEILYEKPVILDELRERLIANIKNSADVMDRRVSELLDVARVQSDNILLQKETIDINELLSNMALELQSIFRTKKQTLNLEIADSLPKINADRSKLEEILYNLLTNANKFSPSSSNVVLRAKENNGQVILEVEDSAPAISKEDKERIFEPYYRSSDSNKRQRFPGLGLGLFIVKNLIELHEGRIWVENRAKKGNNFAFSLPTLDRESRESSD